MKLTYYLWFIIKFSSIFTLKSNVYNPSLFHTSYITYNKVLGRPTTANIRYS